MPSERAAANEALQRARAIGELNWLNKEGCRSEEEAAEMESKTLSTSFPSRQQPPFLSLDSNSL
ncbi:hypothetical protein, partial [Escherichia coli]